MILLGSVSARIFLTTEAINGDSPLQTLFVRADVILFVILAHSPVLPYRHRVERRFMMEMGAGPTSMSKICPETKDNLKGIQLSDIKYSHSPE